MEEEIEKDIEEEIEIQDETRGLNKHIKNFWGPVQEYLEYIYLDPVS